LTDGRPGGKAAFTHVKPTFFPTPAAWRSWLEKNHGRKQELLVGFYKKGRGKPSITWPESVDQALCFGWIDGVRKSIDEDSYSIRFTPRRVGSIWSAVNIKRAGELTRDKLMSPAGLAAFARRRDDRSAIYAYEQRQKPRLSPEHQKALEANARAWKFLQAQAPSYQRLVTFWVVSAKRPETQQKRLQLLIADSAAGRRIGALIPPGKARATSGKS
jgi:uncharacterized protein YdeI (YjbR/CyaY-like superfamily)